MSTRRTTRATSKAASSRGSTPAISEIDIPATPSTRRTSSRRAGSATPLPAISSRFSTAYGTNTTVQPAALKVPEAGQNIENILDDVLKQPLSTLPAVREEDTPSDTENSRGGRSQTARGNHGGRGGRQVASSIPAADRSYDNESHIFGEAGLESSVISSSELGFVQDAPEPPKSRRRTRQEIERQEQQERLHEKGRILETSRTRVQAPCPVAKESWSHWRSRQEDVALDLIAKLVKPLLSILARFNTTLGYMTSVGFLVLFAVLLFASSGSYRWFGLSDFRHNVGQFVPEYIAHPFSNFSPNVVQDIQRRVNAAEYDIAWLKKRADLDSKAIAHLNQILPNEIVVRKDKSGNLEITQEFWHALDAKMRSENVYLHNEVTGKPSKGSSTTDISMVLVENLMEKSKMWDRFLHNNRAQLNAWVGEDFDARFPEKLKGSINEGVVASKSEFIELVRQNWEDTQKEIKVEIRKLAKQLDGTIRHIGQVGQADQDAVAHTKEDIQAISANVFKSMFSTAQLEALSKANKNVMVAQSLNRINHFSQGTGAVVNPKLTSPNYLFPSMDRNPVIKGVSWLLFKPIPSPNPPEVALQRWEEHGDCWCSPSKDAAGFGPSLAAIIHNQIRPDNIVIEHVPSSGSLEPGSTPKDMELLVYIEDEETYFAVKRRSEHVFQEENPEDEQHPFGFVRIGAWTYDAHALNNIQSFQPQILLSSFQGSHSHTNRLIVRSKNNWGGDSVGFTCLYRVRVNGEIASKASD